MDREEAARGRRARRSRHQDHPLMALARIHRGLETLYRVDSGVDVHDFVISEASRHVIAPTRKPREQLLVMDEAGDLELALCIHPEVLASLDAGIGRHNLGDFLLAIEGVSHFIYAIQCARSARRVSPLELELQAEVAKYVTCLLHDVATSASLRGRLFEDCVYAHALDSDARERYRVANDNAHRYAL